MLPESRIVARLLMAGAKDAEWDKAIRTDNLLQKSSPATAIRQARLIRFRLGSISPSLWPLVANGDKEVAMQALFAAALKHSELLSDFVRDVVADHVRRLEMTLSPREWEQFLADCQARDPAVGTWSESTRRKLLQVVLRILAETRCLESTRSLRLLQPHIHPNVADTLKRAGEQRLLMLMELRA
ncbi:MAG: DUF1819 family protein [Lysobacteraceae bacterium]|nr:MAG: DUF1819 family protein [Xanthomonadaceae bacterium]